MTLFLTSSPTGPLDGSRLVDGLDAMNGFVEELAARWQGRARCLIVAASPGRACWQRPDGRLFC